MEALLRHMDAAPLRAGTDAPGGGGEAMVERGLDLDVLLAEEVVEYLTAASASMALDDFVDVLQGFCPDFDAAAVGESEEVVRLYAGLNCPDDVEAATTEKDQRGLSEESDEIAPTKEAGSDGDSGRCSSLGNSLGVSNSNSNSNSKLDDKVDQLLGSVCPPGSSASAVQFVLERLCGGSVEAAAMLILDKGMGSLEAQCARSEALEAERAAAAAAQAAKDDARVRKAVMQQFDEFSVRVGGKAQKSGAAHARAAKKEQKRASKVAQREKQARQTMYLDGQIVSRKGERFQVADKAPVWDGGSKGRVMNKGKRGPGWVAG